MKSKGFEKRFLLIPPTREAKALRASKERNPDTSVQPPRARRLVAADAPSLALTVLALYPSVE